MIRFLLCNPSVRPQNYIGTLPDSDRPEAFGQHTNADMASLIQESNEMLATLVSLQPRVVSAEGRSSEDHIFDLAGELLAMLPRNIEIAEDDAGIPLAAGGGRRGGGGPSRGRHGGGGGAGGSESTLYSTVLVQVCPIDCVCGGGVGGVLSPECVPFGCPPQFSTRPT